MLVISILAFVAYLLTVRAAIAETTRAELSASSRQALREVVKTSWVRPSGATAILSLADDEPER